LLPLKLKICTFNCVYCQYGWTQVHADRLEDPALWPDISVFSEKLEEVLQTIEPPAAYLTFSGNGEPTLHPHFPEFVDELLRLRNRYHSGAKTAILSNSSTVSKKHIRQAIEKLDVRIMKLDCGNDRYFKKYNHPVGNILLRDIVEGLKNLGDVTIQALFAAGDGGNYAEDNIRDWIEQVGEIEPILVQLYTLDRGYPSDKIFPVSKENLVSIQQQLQAINVRAEVYV
jgi:wyosine [tRNA(Phe)-imidazoG37] synthetase (radical SAM superfamily)